MTDADTLPASTEVASNEVATPEVVTPEVATNEVTLTETPVATPAQEQPKAATKAPAKAKKSAAPVKAPAKAPAKAPVKAAPAKKAAAPAKPVPAKAKAVTSTTNLVEFVKASGKVPLAVRLRELINQKNPVLNNDAIWAIVQKEYDLPDAKKGYVQGQRIYMVRLADKQAARVVAATKAPATKAAKA